MTAQINDPIQYKSKEWDLLASTSDFKLDPNDYGLQPVAPCTACWNGYFGEYSIAYKKLKINKLWVFLGWPGFPGRYDETKEELIYPPLLGVEAKKTESFMGFDHYYELNKEIDFTGKMLLGSDFIADYYVHMGYQHTWAYKTLVQLEFENGVLINSKDYSDAAEKLRKKLETNPNLLQDVFFVGSNLSREYKDKMWCIEHYDEIDN